MTPADREPTAGSPALTPAEWRTLKLWHVGKMIGGKVRGMVVLDLPETHKRGAAACALYGQPFGFTQDDVDRLRRVAEASLVNYKAWRDPEEMAFVDSLNSIADRISALLPPAPPTTEPQ